jgi:DNA-binding NarL/FixJ family response regulator
MDTQLRLLVVGNNCFFNEALAEQVKAQNNISSVTTTTPEALFVNTFTSTFDLILIDANVGALSLADMIRNVREVFVEAKIIVLGVDQKELLPIIEAGAHGYVLQEQSFTEVAKTIEAVQRNQVRCSSRIAASVFNRISELSRGKEENNEKLTQREQQILKLIASGFSNKDISRQLRITLCTVKNHVHNILSKLQVHRRQDAIQYALRNRIIPQLYQDKFYLFFLVLPINCL